MAMRLLLAEAVRYGELVDVVLGDFGEGLNLVLGRNEAGKSTFTSLIRHVLYGFPRRRGGERLYQPPSGDARVGRLVFGEGGERWVVERTDGVRGGEVTVHGPQGAEPGELFLEPITHGVDAGVYRTVFGFSLDELSDLSSLGDIQSHLYATATGLRVNPHEVQEELRSRMGELWAPRARTKHLHRLNKELQELRKERRQYEEIAERFRDDRERRQAIALELEEADVALGATRMEEERLAALLAEGRGLEERIREDEEAVAERRLEAQQAQREAEALEVDEGLLAWAREVEGIGARVELFRSEAERLRQDAEKLREIERDIARRASGMGEQWSAEDARNFHIDMDLENQLYEMGERILGAQRGRDETARRAADARAEHRESRRAAEERSEELGLGVGDEIADVIGARLETIDLLIATAGERPDAGASWFPGLAALAVGAILAAVGIALGDRLLALAALLPGVLGLGLLIDAWRARHRGPDVEGFLPVLGLESQPTPSELMWLRDALQGYQGLWTVERECERMASARETTALAAAAAHGRVWGEWLDWLGEHKLETSSNAPGGVRRLIGLLREMRSSIEAQHEIEARIEERRSGLTEFEAQARRVGAVTGDVTGFDEVLHGVRSLLARLAATREAAEMLRQLRLKESAALERAEVLESRAESTQRRLQVLLRSTGVGDEAMLADLEAAVAVARDRSSEVEKAREELLQARATLDGRLEIGARECASAELRLAETGLEERIADGLESYAVNAVAERLLGEALESYEAERQPAVIQRAQEIFSSLTDGRYTRLATPIGRFEPSVADQKSAGKTPEELSRATAEQLFLALRLSYIENLAGAHPALPILMDDVLVNFDDQRRPAAARVIADFAAGRQIIFFTCHSATIDAFAEAGVKGLLELG
jgi:uncharacterized protein YhaN